MAIEKEQILDLLNAEGEFDSKADSLMALIQDDFSAQLNAIKMNKEAIKQEKTEEIAKRHAVEKERDDLKALAQKLEKQLKDTAPEALQKGFEQRLQENANLYETKLREAESKLQEQKDKITNLERTQLKLKCMEEFNVAIKGKNISPDAVNEFADYVMGVDCHKFDYRPTGNGESVLATADGRTIKQAVEAGCLTSFGKNCILNTSFGGGAEGGTKRIDPKDNPFITKNLTKQMELYRENPELYNRLKAAAGC